MGTELDLSVIRKNIDAIDDQLLELFRQRMDLTCQVAQYKAAHNMVVFQSEREKAIIRSVRDRSPEELKSSAEFLFTNIMDISKCRQNNAITPAVEIPHKSAIKPGASVAVQGIAGAYGHAAAVKLFPDGKSAATRITAWCRWRTAPPAKSPPTWSFSRSTAFTSTAPSQSPAPTSSPRSTA